MNRSFTCPHCHSDNIQSFEMVYSNGVSTSTHSTIGVGFAGRFGVGTATTNSTSVTNLSQSVAPPEKKSYIKNFLLGTVAVMVLQILLQALISRVFGGIASWFAFAGMIYWLYKDVYLWNRNVYPALLEDWYHSYLCLKCGHRFIL